MRIVSALLAVSCASISVGQSWPTTRAERSNYLETSHYADVVDFLARLQSAGAPMSVQMMGKSAEGRDMPLAIASYPPVNSPAEARRLGKPIIYIQANIHAGEVEGKEAALMVLRRLCQDPKGLLSKVVLLVAPIYNADGNEKFGPVERNRPEQDGPTVVGLRPNGQGFDLNRDAIKAESPEMNGLLQYVYNTWDPDVMMDLHTTDGTRHGWELTYSPSLNPNTEPEIMRMSRDVIIPAVRKQIESETGLRLFDYGNAETRGGKQAWYSFEPFGRYCTNYVGLRNRIAILSEATTYIPFKARVEITDRFVMATLEWVASHSKAVVDATRRADARVVGWGTFPSTAPALGVRFDFASRGEEVVLLEHREKGETNAGRPKALDKVKMPIYDRFVATKTAHFPAAYFIPATATKLVDLLKRQGIVVEKLAATWDGTVDAFTISEFKQAERAFQTHRLIELTGQFGKQKTTVAVGGYLVRTSQPLGIMAFQILEPEGQDGAVSWGFLGESFKTGDVYPILKTFDPVSVSTVRA